MKLGIKAKNRGFARRKWSFQRIRSCNIYFDWQDAYQSEWVNRLRRFLCLSLVALRCNVGRTLVPLELGKIRIP